MRRAVLIAIVLLSGCKGMGALGHVLGHVGHAAALSGRVLSPVARAAVHALPHVARAANIAANVAIATQPIRVEVGAEDEVIEHPETVEGPLLDDGDACGYCPDTSECGACGDANGVQCVLTPPGAYTRCESQMKLRPPGG